MKIYTQKELNKIKELHTTWLLGEKRGKRANLSRSDLSGADLCGADFSGADFSGANLCGANLYRSDLSGADFSGANLYRANLCRADLCGADLCGADLSGADFSGANLYRANLYRADFSGANLCGAEFTEKIKVKSKKKTATYIGSDYYCVFIGSIIKIGCEVHYRSSWEKFTTAQIKIMDGDKAVKFWRKEKQVILNISRTLSR